MSRFVDQSTTSGAHRQSTDFHLPHRQSSQAELRVKLTDKVELHQLSLIWNMRAALSLMVLVEMVVLTSGVKPANGPDYLALKAADKLNLLWENCIEELQSSRWFNFIQMAELFVEPMCPVFR